MIERDTVGTLKGGMSDEEVVEAQRVGGESGVASRPAGQIALSVKLHFPDGAARRVGDEESAVLVERESVGH